MDGHRVMKVKNLSDLRSPNILKHWRRSTVVGRADRSGNRQLLPPPNFGKIPLQIVYENT